MVNSKAKNPPTIAPLARMLTTHAVLCFIRASPAQASSCLASANLARLYYTLIPLEARRSEAVFKPGRHNLLVRQQLTASCQLISDAAKVGRRIRVG